MSQRSYLSIGDVLSLLREEFPDVTISKIRFLESQGLVDPERSPSGYRKFYEHDVARLRWVLRAQRDQFLPLKVIRDRLAAAGNGVPSDDEWPEAEPADDLGQADPVPAEDASEPEPPSTSPAASEDPEARPHVRAEIEELPRAAPAEPAPRARVDADGAAPEVPQEPPEPQEPPHAREVRRDAPGAAARPGVLAPTLAGVSLTPAELCAATGLSPQSVGDLERLGLVSAMSVAGGEFYDENALMIAKLAAEFARFGIEPRHLRLYRNAADREVGLVEQVVTPLLRQRNPEARRRASDAAEELTRLGQSLRAALVRAALHRQLGT